MKQLAYFLQLKKESPQAGRMSLPQVLAGRNREADVLSQALAGRNRGLAGENRRPAGENRRPAGKNPEGEGKLTPADSS